MTSHLAPSASRRAPDRRPWAAWAGGLALAAVLPLVPAPGAAQAPAQPAASRAPAPPPPLSLAPPPAPGRAAQRAVPAPAPVVPIKPASPSPDSLRRAAAAPFPAPPANAVALCADGTYLVAPAAPDGCTAHGGLRIRMLPAAPPAPPGAVRVTTGPAALRAATPPAGATMRCKDGTFLAGAPSDAACTGHGGLAAALPAPRQAPAGPARVRRP